MVLTPSNSVTPQGTSVAQGYNSCYPCPIALPHFFPHRLTEVRHLRNNPLEVGREDLLFGTTKGQYSDLAHLGHLREYLHYRGVDGTLDHRGELVGHGCSPRETSISIAANLLTMGAPRGDTSIPIKSYVITDRLTMGPACLIIIC